MHALLPQAAGLENLVEWNTRREVDIKVAELMQSLTEMITADPPLPAADVVAHAKSKKDESKLPER